MWPSDGGEPACYASVTLSRAEAGSEGDRTAAKLLTVASAPARRGGIQPAVGALRQSACLIVPVVSITDTMRSHEAVV